LTPDLLADLRDDLVSLMNVAQNIAQGLSKDHAALKRAAVECLADLQATLDVLHDDTVPRVRLWGIDAPEKKQPFGVRAKEFTADLVFAQEVRVRVRGSDRYKRTLGEILLPDGRNLGHELLKAGLAWWYQQFAKNERALADLEQEAKAARRGLWSEPGPVQPWVWRKTRH
jgi:micrococcal nuclease